MPQKTSPFLEGKWGWNLGEGGWNSGADENWLKFSYMFDANVDAIVSTLPAAVNGEAYFLTTDNRIYFVVDGTFYSTPVPKWFEFKIKSTGAVYVFDGSTVSVSPSGQQAADALEAELEAPTGTDKVGFLGSSLTQRLLNLPTLEDYGSSIVDGTTSNQDRWVAAAAANAGKKVWVPAKTYVSTGNIPGFHNVDWVGPGVLKRGSYTFSIDQYGSVMNTLYCATSGSSTNDGLSPAEPMLSPNAAVNLWGVKYAANAAGPWKIKIASGQYNESIIAQGFQSNKEIFLEGEYDVATQTPLTIFDGSFGATNSGIIFTTYGWVTCKWILCRNFTTVGAGGFNIGNFGRMTIDTCHAYNNDLVGFSAAQAADLRIVGRCYILLAAGSTGVTYYRQCTGSWSDATGEIIVDGQNNAATTGVLVRDNSYVVAGCKLTIRNCTAQAVWLRRHSYLEVRDYEITNNNIGFDLRDLSLLAPNGGTQVLSGNTQDYSYRNFSLLWDSASNSCFGATGPSVQSPSSGAYAHVITGKDQVGTQYLTDASTSVINIDFNKKGTITYAQADNSLRLSLNNVDTYRWSSTAYFPVVTRDIGGSAFPWTNGYIQTLRPGGGTVIWTSGTGTPEGSRVAPVGSLYTRTDGGGNTTLYIKESGTGNTGWVAK